MIETGKNRVKIPINNKEKGQPRTLLSEGRIQMDLTLRHRTENERFNGNQR